MSLLFFVGTTIALLSLYGIYNANKELQQIEEDELTEFYRGCAETDAMMGFDTRSLALEIAKDFDIDLGLTKEEKQ